VAHFIEKAGADLRAIREEQVKQAKELASVRGELADAKKLSSMTSIAVEGIVSKQNGMDRVLEAIVMHLDRQRQSNSPATAVPAAAAATDATPVVQQGEPPVA